jgi:hypothetical protein
MSSHNCKRLFLSLDAFRKVSALVRLKDIIIISNLESFNSLLPRIRKRDYIDDSSLLNLLEEGHTNQAIMSVHDVFGRRNYFSLSAPYITLIMSYEVSFSPYFGGYSNPPKITHLG